MDFPARATQIPGLGFENPVHECRALAERGRVTGERQGRPDPEVPERTRRRTFTAAYKQDILAAYEAAPDGEKGAILRREGLYSSLITEWRRARDAGALAGLKPRGRPVADPRDRQARRYVSQAVESGRVAVPDESSVFTVRLPVRLAAAVREHGRASGRTISSVAAQALEEFLGRAQGNGRRGERAAGRDGIRLQPSRGGRNVSGDSDGYVHRRLHRRTPQVS
jgi:hypothetical protein